MYWAASKELKDPSNSSQCIQREMFCFGFRFFFNQLTHLGLDIFQRTIRDMFQRTHTHTYNFSALNYILTEVQANAN